MGHVTFFFVDLSAAHTHMKRAKGEDPVFLLLPLEVITTRILELLHPLEIACLRTVNKFFHSILVQKKKTGIKEIVREGGGNLHLIKWAVEYAKYPVSTDTFSMAAEFDNREVIQYLKERGYQWDASTCNSAAKMGNLFLLQWLRQREDPCPWDESTTLTAAQYGHLHVFVDACKKGCPFSYNSCGMTISFFFAKELQELKEFQSKNNGERDFIEKYKHVLTWFSKGTIGGLVNVIHPAFAETLLEFAQLIINEFKVIVKREEKKKECNPLIMELCHLLKEY